MTTTSNTATETITDAWDDTLKIDKGRRVEDSVNLTIRESRADRFGYLAGVKVADLRAALDRLYPPTAPAPVAEAAPVIDHGVAIRFARKLKDAGHPALYFNVPTGVITEALREAINPRPGLAELRAAVSDAHRATTPDALTDALYAAGVRVTAGAAA